MVDNYDKAGLISVESRMQRSRLMCAYDQGNTEMTGAESCSAPARGLNRGLSRPDQREE